MKEQVPDFAVILPLANESASFHELAERLRDQLNKFGTGKVYLVVDDASKDNTRQLCMDRQSSDPRFVCVYDPSNKNVVDAYLRGYRAAYEGGHEFIIEMDAGLSHDPTALGQFISAYRSGFNCVFGSRFVKGGAMIDSNIKRRFLSKGGTLVSNLLLGTRLLDMTSGFQGFSREITGKILTYGLRSKAHFYQTEVRYLLRNEKCIELPIVYRAPSPSVSTGALVDSLKNLGYYFFNRLIFKPKVIS